MGLLNSSDDTYNQVPIDAKTQSLIKNEFTRATASDRDIGNQLNEGVSGVGKSVGLSADQSQRAAQTGENPGMFSAIRNQYNNIANKDIQSVMKKNNSSVPMERANWLHQASTHAMAKSQVETEAFAKLNEANMMAETARANALNSILGSVGAVGGMMMAKRGGRGQASPQQPGNMNGMQMGGGSMDAGGQDSFSVA